MTNKVKRRATNIRDKTRLVLRGSDCSDGLMFGAGCATQDRIRFIGLYALIDRDGVYCLEILSYEFFCRGIVIVVFNGNCCTTPVVEDGLFLFPETGWLW